MTRIFSLDPGSHHAALVGVATRDATPPALALPSSPSPLALLYSHVFPVGRDVPLDPPEVRTRKSDGRTYTIRSRHEVTRDEEQGIAKAIVDVLREQGTELLLVEVVNHQFVDAGGKNPKQVAQAASAQARELTIAERIVASLTTWCLIYRIAVETLTRPSWLATIRRHLAAGLTPGCAPLPPHIRKGAVFDPLLRYHLPALYDGGRLLHALPDAQAESDATGEDDAEGEAGEEGGSPGGYRRPTADTRDAAAQLLAHLLPAPQGTGKRTRARVATVPGEGATGIEALPAAARGQRGPRRTSGEAWRVAEREARQAHREAIGCTCPDGPGRPSKLCPAFALHRAAGKAKR